MKIQLSRASLVVGRVGPRNTKGRSPLHLIRRRPLHRDRGTGRPTPRIHRFMIQNRSPSLPLLPLPHVHPKTQTLGDIGGRVARRDSWRSAERQASGHWTRGRAQLRSKGKGPAGREMRRFLVDTTSRASDGTHGSTSLAQPQASQAQGQGPPPQPNRGVENCYVFKSRLQEYAQKAGFPTPEYHTLKEGPSHEPIFKSTVVINNTKYDSLPGFFNRKAAEQSAAEVALTEIVKSIPTNANIPAVQETGLCKNLLQEYAQKMNYAIPSYICTKQASGIAPFICTVEIGGIQYIGAAARTKKEAEIKAARTALLAIQGQSEGCANGATKYVVVPGKRQGKEAEKKPIETSKLLKVKKGGFKKKWNKRKFMKKNGQAVDVEKDEARVAGDVHDSDVPMHPTIIAQVPSNGIIMLQPNEEARSIMLQPNEEARSVEPETPSDTAMVQPNEEARIVNQEPPSDTAMPQPNEEARRVEQESLSESATVHTNGEIMNTKEEPPSNSAIMQCNKEARTVNQEPPSSASLLQPNKEPRVENSKSVYGHENQSWGVTSLETNKSYGDMPGVDLDPSSAAVSKE